MTTYVFGRNRIWVKSQNTNYFRHDNLNMLNKFLTTDLVSIKDKGVNVSIPKMLTKS